MCISGGCVPRSKMTLLSRIHKNKKGIGYYVEAEI